MITDPPLIVIVVCERNAVRHRVASVRQRQITLLAAMLSVALLMGFWILSSPSAADRLPPGSTVVITATGTPSTSTDQLEPTP